MFQLFFLLCAKLDRHMVADTATTFCGELQGILYHTIPLCLCQSVVNLLTGNTVLDQSVDKTSVEVVASPNSTDGLGGDDGILLAETFLCPQLYWFSSTGINKLLSIKRNLGTVYDIRSFFL